MEGGAWKEKEREGGGWHLYAGMPPKKVIPKEVLPEHIAEMSNAQSDDFFRGQSALEEALYGELQEARTAARELGEDKSTGPWTTYRRKEKAYGTLVLYIHKCMIQASAHDDVCAATRGDYSRVSLLNQNFCRDKTASSVVCKSALNDLTMRAQVPQAMGQRIRNRILAVTKEREDGGGRASSLGFWTKHKDQMLTEFQELLAKITSQSAEHTKMLRALAARTTKIEKDNKHVADKLGKLSESVAAQQLRGDQQDKRTDDCMTSIATLEENVQALQEDTNVRAGKLAALEKRMLCFLRAAQRKGTGSPQRSACASPSSSSPQA